MADLTAFRGPTRPDRVVRAAQRPAAPMLGNCKGDLVEVVVQRRRAARNALFGYEQEPLTLIDLRPTAGSEINGQQQHG